MLHTILAAGGFVIGVFGLLANCGFLTGTYSKTTFAYYTTLSNLLVTLYHGLWLTGLGRAFLGSPAVELSVTCCITVTFLVYHFLLRPAWKGQFKPGITLPKLGNWCVHYIVPLFTIATWLLTADKAAVSFTDALWWLLLPMAYLIFAMIRARLGGPMGPEGHQSQYPYPFMDLDALGVKKFTISILGVVVAFFAVGCAFVGLAYLLG